MKLVMVLEWDVEEADYQPETWGQLVGDLNTVAGLSDMPMASKGYLAVDESAQQVIDVFRDGV
jgi:hypothetical protein